jgi:hypothetical protein
MKYLFLIEIYMIHLKLKKENKVFMVSVRVTFSKERQIVKATETAIILEFSLEIHNIAITQIKNLIDIHLKMDQTIQKSNGKIKIVKGFKGAIV